MSKLFETAWEEDYVSYERYYDTDLQKSVSKKIEVTQEWYEEAANGDYSSILDSSLKLVRKQGTNRKARDEWGYINPIYRNIRDKYWGKSYNKNARIMYLDIETRTGTNSVGFPVPEKALEPISLIQIYDNISETMYVIGLREWKHQSSYTFDYKIKYIQVATESDLVEAFLKIFQALNPLLIYAWNGEGFDFPYIYNRMKKLGMDTNRLSVYGDVKLVSKQMGYKVIYKLQSSGHHFMDLLEVFKKFTFGEQSSYSLDYTAELVLGKKKVSHTEYEAFDDFYMGNYKIPLNPTDEQKNSEIYKQAILGNWDEVKELAHSEFVYYGAQDTHLIYGIDMAKNFTGIMLILSEKMGVLLSDSLGTVKPWSQYIINKAHTNKQVVPKLNISEDEITIKGGYVADPVIGKHEWIMSADVNSMYPLLGMVGFNMSPETFVPKQKLPVDLREIILRYFNDEDEESRFKIPPEVWAETTRLLNKYNYTLGINGAVFNKEKLGMIPEIVTEIYAERKAAKKTMFAYEKQKLLIKDILKDRT